MSIWKSFEFTLLLLIGTGQTTVLALQITQNPELAPHQQAVRDFLERNIGWDSLKDPLTNMYMEEFTEQELNDMNTFYSSSTGRKVIERLQENIGELQKEIEKHSTQ